MVLGLLVKSDYQKHSKRAASCMSAIATVSDSAKC
jgi:hypothetical protein